MCDWTPTWQPHNKFHLIIATEMRRNFTDASCRLPPSEFMRSLFVGPPRWAGYVGKQESSGHQQGEAKVAWIVRYVANGASFLFSQYLTRFANYNAPYGSLGAPSA